MEGAQDSEHSDFPLNQSSLNNLMVMSFKKNTEINLQEKRPGQLRRGKKKKNPHLWEEQLAHLTFSEHSGLGAASGGAPTPAGPSAAGGVGAVTMLPGSVMTDSRGFSPLRPRARRGPDAAGCPQLTREGEKLGLQP